MTGRNLDFLDTHFDAGGVQDENILNNATTETNNDATPNTQEQHQSGQQTQQGQEDFLEHHFQAGTEHQQSTQPDPNAQQQQQQQTQQTQQQTQQQNPGNPNQVNPGDIVDPATGQVLARSGPERRAWQEQNKGKDFVTRGMYDAVRNSVMQQVAPRIQQEFRNLANTANAKINELTAQVKAYEQANTIGTQLGLNPQQVALGAQVISNFFKNPQQTVEYLIAEAAKMGHTIQVNGAAVSGQALTQMLDQRLQPFIQDRQRVQAEQQAYEQAGQELQNFLGRYPDAAPHCDALAEMLNGNADLTLETAYWQLKTVFLERGLDFRFPANAQPQQQTQTQQTQQRQMPSGRPNVGNITHQPQSQMYDPNASWDLTVRQEMERMGYRF